MGDFRFIDRVGIELEGGWSTSQLKAQGAITLAPPSPFREGPVYTIDIHRDDSLHPAVEAMSGEFHVGERVSPPMRPDEAIQWMLSNYPEATHERCGLHVHASFRKTSYYGDLMRRSFYNYFIAEVTKWAEKKDEEGRALGPLFWSRLKGENRYCSRRFIPSKQISLTGKQAIHDHATGREDHLRRTILNYCWSLHKTLECRLFPLWKDPTLAEMGVRKVLSIYEEWLDANAGKKDKTTSAVGTMRGSLLVLEKRRGRRLVQIGDGPPELLAEGED